MTLGYCPVCGKPIYTLRERHIGTAYRNDSENYHISCYDCHKDIWDYYQEKWSEYYEGQGYYYELKPCDKD